MEFPESGEKMHVDKKTLDVGNYILKQAYMCIIPLEKQSQIWQIISSYQGTITLIPQLNCTIADTVNVRNRATKRLQDVTGKSSLETHSWITPDGEYRRKQITKMVYNKSPTQVSEIFWMLPAAKETTTPMP